METPAAANSFSSIDGNTGYDVIPSESNMQNIFIGNLSSDTSEQALRTLFEAFGRVLSVSIVKDRDTAAPRGFAFIEMASDSEAQAAITGLNGTTIDQRKVNVNAARSKKIAVSDVHQQMRRHRDHRY